MSEVTPAGVVSTFASGFDYPDGLAFDASGDLFVANVGGNTVSEVTPAGVVSTFASRLSVPIGLAFDPAGNLYVANANGGGTLSEVTPAGVVTAFASSGFDIPAGLAFDAGNLYVVNNSNNTVSQVSETVTVPFAIGETGVSGTAFGFTASPLTFGFGQTATTLTGTLVSDPGPSQTLTFTLGTPTGGAALGNPYVNTLTITEPRWRRCSSASAARPSTRAPAPSASRSRSRAPALPPSPPSPPGSPVPTAWPSTRRATSSSPMHSTAR